MEGFLYLCVCGVNFLAECAGPGATVELKAKSTQWAAALILIEELFLCAGRLR